MAGGHGRTVAIDADAVKRLRIAKGWKVEDLAKKVGCSLRTATNVERGANVYLFTASNFAEALGVELKDLLCGTFEKSTTKAEQPPAKRAIHVDLKLRIPFPEFDETVDTARLMEFLSKCVNWSAQVNFVAVRDGSTIVTLQIEEHDLVELLNAFRVGNLEEIGVIEVVCPSRSELKQNDYVLHFVEVLRTYGFPDERAMGRSFSQAAAGSIPEKVKVEFEKDRTVVTRLPEEPLPPSLP
jgi:transcriptional regulator with XRE-family HTH domain